MARTSGSLAISSNFEPQIAAPFDARAIVPSKADLTDSGNWTALDGVSYVYKGMTVTVAEDSTTSNNGIYILTGSDVTNINDWLFIGSGSGTGGDGGGATPTLDQVTDAGNTTTNRITVSRINAITGDFSGQVTASMIGVNADNFNGAFEVNGISYQSGRVLFPRLKRKTTGLKFLAIQTGSLGGFGEVTTLDLSHFVSASEYSAGATDTGSLMTTGSVSGNVLTFTKGDGSTFELTVDNSSGGTPDTPLNSFQFNSSNAFGGSEMYYDETNKRVGINIDTPQADLHVRGVNNETGSILLETDSSGSAEKAFAALYFRVADNDGVDYKKFAIIAENTGTEFGHGRLHLALDDNTGNSANAKIADAKLTIDHTGSVFMPDLSNGSKPNVIGFDTTTGQLSYYDTGSIAKVRSATSASYAVTSSYVEEIEVTYATSDTSQTTARAVHVAGTADAVSGTSTTTSPVMSILSGKTLGQDAFFTATWIDNSSAGQQSRPIAIETISGSNQLVFTVDTMNTDVQEAIMFHGIVFV